MNFENDEKINEEIVTENSDETTESDNPESEDDIVVDIDEDVMIDSEELDDVRELAQEEKGMNCKCS